YAATNEGGNYSGFYFGFYVFLPILMAWSIGLFTPQPTDPWGGLGNPYQRRSPGASGRAQGRGL
ncbi:MAG: hypothetical protein ACREXR_22175, partial [Gammaproteobacteria bacterium]